MNRASAIAVIDRHFPGATELDRPLIDTSPAGAGVTVDPDGRLWVDRCGCGRHPYQGHAARPTPRPRRSS